MAKVKVNKGRNRPRVEESESSGNKVVKSSQHRAAGAVAQLVDGELLITSQQSELVPVAQYANVTLGPVQLTWKLGGIDMSVLADIEWEQDDDGDDVTEMTTEQQEVYDKVRGAIRSTSKLIEHSIAEDRELVERSVRLHNEREAAENSKKK